MRGHVVDFLQLPYWPIFNVADMCISAAAVMIMVLAVVRGVGIGGERYTKPTAESVRPRTRAVTDPKVCSCPRGSTANASTPPIARHARVCPAAVQLT